MQPNDPSPSHASFRIYDDIYLDYHSATADETAAAWEHDTASFCDSLIRLREISVQSGHILANIRKHQPDVGHYLALLDKKIDLLAQLVGTVAMGGDIKPSHHVMLGADGMHFDSKQSLSAGMQLQLKLVLFPSHLCLYLQSRVVACTQQAPKEFRVEVSFQKMGETEHEALIRHLLEKQSAELRRGRGEH